jgi:hypothetical protein
MGERSKIPVYFHRPTQNRWIYDYFQQFLFVSHQKSDAAEKSWNIYYPCRAPPHSLHALYISENMLYVIL